MLTPRAFRYLLPLGLLSACQLQPAPTPAHAFPILFPLAVGSYWVYEISSGDQQGQMENRIAAARQVGDQEWFLSVEYGEKFWIRNTAEGQVEAVNLYTQGEDANVFDHLDPGSLREELMFRFPAQAGDSWIALENRIRYEGRRTITTPAGTFECHFYSITDYQANPAGDAYSHSCIAEGVGVIYSDDTLPDGTLEIARLQHWGKR